MFAVLGFCGIGVFTGTYRVFAKLCSFLVGFWLSGFGGFGSKRSAFCNRCSVLRLGVSGPDFDSFLSSVGLGLVAFCLGAGFALHAR